MKKEMFLNEKEKGWTLIELMIVIIVVAIILVVVVSTYGNAINRSREAATKDSLGALRSALTAFYADREGVWPENIHDPRYDPPFCGRYIDAVPVVQLKRGLPETNAVRYDDVVDSRGGWLYNSDSGRVVINHSATDTKGIYYSSY
ncbi:TPA: hypothetical protein DCX15_04765 [bacterium]|nr:hypothetical protein [bacterium]